MKLWFKYPSNFSQIPEIRELRDQLGNDGVMKLLMIIERIMSEMDSNMTETSKMGYAFDTKKGWACYLRTTERFLATYLEVLVNLRLTSLEPTGNLLGVYTPLLQSTVESFKKNAEKKPSKKKKNTQNIILSKENNNILREKNSESPPFLGKGDSRNFLQNLENVPVKNMGDVANPVLNNGHNTTTPVIKRRHFDDHGDLTFEEYLRIYSVDIAPSIEAVIVRLTRITREPRVREIIIQELRYMEMEDLVQWI